MDERKQINDMMRLMCADFGEGCKDCPFRIYPPCQAEAHAEAIFEADYRKRSEVAREIFEEIYDTCFDQYGYIDYAALATLRDKYTDERRLK